jgi:hypothetical protein
MVGAQVQKKKDQKFGDFLIQQAEKTPRYAMADTYNKYLAMAKQDPVGDYMREQAARNQATSVGALKSGGAKSILGGLGAVQQQGFANQAETAGASQKNLQSAMQNYAQQQQSVMDANIGQREKELRGVFQGELFKKQAKDTAREAMFAGAESLFKSGMKFAGANNYFKKAPETFMPNTDIYKAEPAFFKDKGIVSHAMNKFGETIGFGANMGPYQFGGPVQKNEVNSIGTGYYDAGNYFFRNNGGFINKTPGAFSHEKNPIDIVAKGNKIGEMTGGEYILNPSQAAKMQSLASSQKKEALQRYVKTLFNKFNSK